VSGSDPDDRLDALPLSDGASPAGAAGAGDAPRGRRRRSQGWRLAGTAAALVAVTGCGARLDPVTGTSTAPVEIELPLGLDAVRQRLGDLFAGGDGTAPARRLAPGDWLACFTLFDRRPPAAGVQSVFPADAALRAAARGDAAMNRYLARGAEERARDLFLYDARDCQWASEYRARGRPVGFSCDFILHLETAGAHATRLEALEVRPQATIGTRLGFTAHGLGIGWVETRRAVLPTLRDRAQLLARIRGSLDGAAGPGSSARSRPRAAGYFGAFAALRGSSAGFTYLKSTGPCP